MKYKGVTAGLALTLQALVLAQGAIRPGAPASPASPADISGMWYARGLPGDIFAKFDPLMTPWAREQLNAARPSFGPRSVLLTETNDPVYKCMPPGVPRIYFHPFPVQVVQIPGQVLLLFEYDHTVRHVYTDGRKHPEDSNATWLGHSVGHWEGDTLVVDTVGFNDKTWIDRMGHAHSDQLHVVERFRRIAPDNLQIDVTVEDPQAYTQPITATINLRFQPKWDIAEMYCVDTLGFEKFEK